MRVRARILLPLLVVLALGVAVWQTLPRLSALALVVRAARARGVLAHAAGAMAIPARRERVRAVDTRHGPVSTQLYRPSRGGRRTVLLVPGLHMDGLEEERLVTLATDLAQTGLQVLAVAPPDLMRYRVTPRSVDELEDVAAWAAAQPDLAPDGKVGIAGVSFAGALALVAAGRSDVREHVAFVLSVGGYADLPRVLRYLCGAGGDPPPSREDARDLVSGGAAIRVPKPHDYGAVVALLNLGDKVVPAAQVPALQDAITAFLRASSVDRIDPERGREAFAQARRLGEQLPEPSRALMKDVSDRDVGALGLALRPSLADLELPAALSPDRSPPPTAPVFLLHGADDSVVPASELVWLARALHGKTRVRALASRLITHAEINRGAALFEMWQLAGFFCDLMGR